MRHKMLTQRVPFCIDVMAKKGTSQHFVTHVMPPWGRGVAEEARTKEARKGLSKAAAVHGAG